VIRAVLPNPLRYATIATFTLGAMVSCGSVQGMRLAFSAEAIDVSAGETPYFNTFTPDPVAFAAAQRAQGVAIRNSIESMRWSRAAILFVLSGVAAVVFVSALRLRWPSGIQRVAVARLLSNAARVAAVVRTLDGAQELVIVRNAVAAYEKTLNEYHVNFADGGATMAVFSAASVVTTVLLTGFFIVASNYFASDRIIQTFELMDRNTQEEE
jgi:hypothetical protein